MFISGKIYTNRYGDKYTFSILEDLKYLFVMTGDSMEYGRIGGKNGQEGINYNDLGMFDPSGGPYVALGMEINGKPIVNIRRSALGMVVTVE